MVDTDAEYFNPKVNIDEEEKVYFEREVPSLNLQEQENAEEAHDTRSLQISQGEKRLWSGFLAFLVVLALALVLN